MMIRASKTRVFLLYPSEIGSRNARLCANCNVSMFGISCTSAAVFLNVLGSYSGKFKGSVVGR